MATTYRFSVRSLQHPGLSRVVELGGQHTLADLADLVAAELGLEGEHAWSFWLGGEWSEPELEHAADPGGGRLPRHPRLDTLGLQPGDLLAHLHDFGEVRRHLLTLVAADAAGPGVASPRVVARVGRAPEYWSPLGVEEACADGPVAPPLAGPGTLVADPPEALVRRVNRAIDAFHDEQRQPPARRVVRHGARVAQEVFATCPTAGHLARLEHQLGGSLAEWVAGVAAALDEPALLPVAAELRERVRATSGWPQLPAPLLARLAAALRRHDRPGPPRPLHGDPAALAALAGEVLDACPTPGRLMALGWLLARPVGAWLESVALTLGLRGWPVEAASIATRLAALCDRPEILADLAEALARAGALARESASSALIALLAAVEPAPEWRSGRAEVGWARFQAAAGDRAGAAVRLRALLGRRHLGLAARRAGLAALAELHAAGEAGHGALVERAA